MSESVSALANSVVSADKLRSSSEQMRECVADLALRGAAVWTGPLDELVDTLYDLGRVDLCLARLLEGHSDGLRILQQAGRQPTPGVYGVWASRSVGTGLGASPVDHDWRLTGELRFASGVDLIDRALVTAWTDPDHHLLVDVSAYFGKPDRESWRFPGMDAARTFTIHVDTTSAEADVVGETDFYLQRPGFVVGGLCVAAVWAGGAQHLLDVVSTSVRPYPLSAHQLRRLGAMEQAVWECRRVLRSTTARLAGLSAEVRTREIAMTRSCVVRACEIVLDEAPRIVGPAGLSRNARLARVLEDLAVYIRQHHLDHELASLGEHAQTSHELLAE